MSERETERLSQGAPPETTELIDEYAAGQQWEGELDELPPRPRRRLLTPVTGSLLGVLLLAGGFLGGVLAEKGQDSNASAGASAFGGRGAAGLGNAASRRAGGGAAAFGGGQAGGGTTGQVSTVRGRTLYIQDDQGNTVKVNLAKGANVSRTTGSSIRAVHPGDSVVVQGAQAGDGSISASSVRATAASLGGGGALAQLFGGGQSGGGQGAGRGAQSGVAIAPPGGG
ncbi:MAG: hypothetical protein QOD76_1747 [Solirubrobacteraceae bacterium]|nr:hypothetical protein [Solirubrobacteraceae bacterium]